MAPAAATRCSGNADHWDDDTFVQETLRNHKGHELKVVERIRLEGSRLIYKHAITGPGDKHDQREITFDIPEKPEQQ